MELKEELKMRLIEQLNLEGMTPADIADDTELFGDSLGLDSIDALEIIVLVDNYYGLNVSDPELGKKIFRSVNTLAEFIEESRN